MPKTAFKWIKSLEKIEIILVKSIPKEEITATNLIKLVPKPKTAFKWTKSLEKIAIILAKRIP